MQLFKRHLLRVAGLFACLLSVYSVNSNAQIKVFPVKAFFYNDSANSPLDSRFLSVVKARTAALLSEKVKVDLDAAFNDKLGSLDKNTANRTFATSFHLTRAMSYRVDKGNGNSDVVTSLTASIYFTNVTTGEILSTVTKSSLKIAVLPNQTNLDGAAEKLFSDTLDSLMSDLIQEAAKNFSPLIVNVKVLDRYENLFVLDAGYSKGIQTGDQLNDATGQLVEIVYSSKNYAIATPVIASNINTGAVFQKYLSHPADGKIKPRTVVLVESLPQGYSKEYIGQLFSELVSNKAPLTVLQVNTGFSRLLQTVIQQTSISTFDTARRKTPDLFILLRVAEPLVAETKTNLEFKTNRHYETIAFADVVDTSGRVNFSVVGKNIIDDSITKNIGPGIAERKEVNVKNALVDLAEKLSEMSEPRLEQVNTTMPSREGLTIPNQNKIFFLKQKGTVIRKSNLTVNKETVWIPISEAFVESTDRAGSTFLGLGIPFNDHGQPSKGDIFEVARIGVSPKSAHAFTVCGPEESLGNLRTPSLTYLTSQSLGEYMPGILYNPSISHISNTLIGQTTGFADSVKWKIPQTSLCVQPVERVVGGEEQCTGQCERAINARYTLRVKLGEEIISRIAFESQFKSTGYYKGTETSQINKLLDSDLIDEAKMLLNKAAEKIKLAPN